MWLTAKVLDVMKNKLFLDCGLIHGQIQKPKVCWGLYRHVADHVEKWDAVKHTLMSVSKTYLFHDSLGWPLHFVKEKHIHENPGGNHKRSWNSWIYIEIHEITKKHENHENRTKIDKPRKHEKTGAVKIREKTMKKTFLTMKTAWKTWNSKIIRT